MLFTNIQLNDFSPSLLHLLEHLCIEKPEGQEWAMTGVNIGILLEPVFGRMTL
jgi:hypothetical protein